ncbi:MAG: hypothetical protein HY909_23260 [Deltaproteobacteria bacterium]|nr:hypothetical protein [Deltaproteobacteria bacterium]
MSQKLLFNVVVFEGMINDSTTLFMYSKPEYNALLGSAGNLVGQLCLDATPNTSTTVTATYQLSNTGLESDWKDANGPPTVGITATTEAPKSTIFTITSLSERGALGRFKLSSSKAGAYVRLIVAGRE